MRYRKNKSRTIITYALCIIICLLGITNSNAQMECRKKLDDYNRKPDFPTGQLPEYENCLNNIESYYRGLISLEQKNKEKITDLKTALSQNNIYLNQARQAKDSLGVENYTHKEKDLNKEIADSIGKLEQNKNEITSYKTTLKSSYEKIIAYYTSIENPKLKDWQRRLDALTASY